MATWTSITKKAEDATLAAFISIAGADATDIPIVWETGGSGGELASPCVVIYSAGHEALTPDTGICGRNNFDVEIVAEVRTNGEHTIRAVHSTWAGLVEAVGNQSADQMVGALNAAGVSGFTATRWKFLRAANDYNGQERVSSFYFSLICSHA